ncbi:hypothetical protein E2C01_034751 [Portunus trituberculatus]|uniref:Uncharacterized protein n=1 Tax=Portunus trituberculatus TaxID=210409 RepID=A0A5B7F768_PORTR|nr:hypothetical protein [Portunus trituberculatus]
MHPDNDLSPADVTTKPCSYGDPGTSSDPATPSPSSSNLVSPEITPESVLTIMEDGKFNLSLLCMKSAFSKDTFTFLTILDEASVEPEQCKGVLVTTKGATKKQTDQDEVYPPLIAFNMHFQACISLVAKRGKLSKDKNIHKKRPT